MTGSEGDVAKAQEIYAFLDEVNQYSRFPVFNSGIDPFWSQMRPFEAMRQIDVINEGLDKESTNQGSVK